MVEHAHDEPMPPTRPPEGPPREVERAPRAGSEDVEWEEYARRLRALARSDAARAVVEETVGRMRADPAAAAAEYRRALALL